MEELLLNDDFIVHLSENVLRQLIEMHSRKIIPELDAIIIIGSSVFKETRRKKSDLDLVFLIEDNNNQELYKADYQLNRIPYENNLLAARFDIKIYTVNTFKKELYEDSLTKVFAILNAYKIIHSLSGAAEDIIATAAERMNENVLAARSHLEIIDIKTELLNLKNYFSEGREILLSEKISSNYTLLNLRLNEYLKDFLIQLQQLLFASDLQNKIGNTQLNSLVKNLLVFANNDGTRLLDENKYLIDARVNAVLEQLNLVLNANEDMSFKITESFNLINQAFLNYFATPVISSIDEPFEYFRTQPII